MFWRCSRVQKERPDELNYSVVTGVRSRNASESGRGGILALS